MNSSSAGAPLGQCSVRHEREGERESHYYHFYGKTFLFLMEVDLGNLLRITFSKLNFNQKDKFLPIPMSGTLNHAVTQSVRQTLP